MFFTKDLTLMGLNEVNFLKGKQFYQFKFFLLMPNY
jgi:hypothetical protein